MAIGVGAAPLSYSGYTPGQGGTGQGPRDVPVGLRGSVSLGSGLRTGVTVVEHAIKTSAELEEARQRAREALREQLDLEAKAAEADQAVRKQEAQGRTDPSTAPPSQASATPQDDPESDR